MRIRKNAKLSAAPVVGSPSIPPQNFQAHICQLNRSPWDVPSPYSPPRSSSPFSSSHNFQAELDYSFRGNGSFDDSIAAVESKYEECATIIDSRNEGSVKVEEAPENGIQFEDEIMQCQQPESDPTPKKVEKAEAAAPPKRRGRPRKAPVAPANPNEFYYYSGFGPRWGKKRGGGKNSGAEANFDNNILSCLSLGASPSSASQIDDILMENVEQLDYIDDDDDDEEEISGGDGGEIGRKRGRKPIKARSLKSLM